jgi:hypothetical protein
MFKNYKIHEERRDFEFSNDMNKFLMFVVVVAVIIIIIVVV